MRFWDSSAVVPLCVEEPRTPPVCQLLEADPGMVVWWGSAVECWSALARLRRDGQLSLPEDEEARAILDALARAWVEILPTDDVRTLAGRILRVHSLRAAAAFQLAAALTWALPARAPAQISRSTCDSPTRRGWRGGDPSAGAARGARATRRPDPRLEGLRRRAWGRVMTRPQHAVDSARQQELFVSALQVSLPGPPTA